MLDFIQVLSIVAGALLIGLIVFAILYFYFDKILHDKRFRKKFRELENIRENLKRRIIK